MQSNVKTVADYVLELDDKRCAIVSKLRQTILDNYRRDFKKRWDMGKSCLHLNPNQLIPYD